jgi:hypothetical protein
MKTVKMISKAAFSTLALGTMAFVSNQVLAISPLTRSPKFSDMSYHRAQVKISRSVEVKTLKSNGELESADMFEDLIKKNLSAKDFPNQIYVDYNFKDQKLSSVAQSDFRRHIKHILNSKNFRVVQSKNKAQFILRFSDLSLHKHSHEYVGQIGLILEERDPEFKETTMQILDLKSSEKTAKSSVIALGNAFEDASKGMANFGAEVYDQTLFVKN